jgi:hypothetical protein
LKNQFGKTAWLLFGAGLLTIFLVACSTTQISMHAVGTKPPLCGSSGLRERALVLWGPAWRIDQKDVPIREQMASNAITKFFTNDSCYSDVTVLRSLADRDVVTLSDAEVLKNIAALPKRYDKIILLRVEELGPVVTLSLSPVPIAGATEVVFRTKILDANSYALDTEVTTHWKNDQPYLLKGIKTLEQDFQDALSSVFLHKVKAVSRVF